MCLTNHGLANWRAVGLAAAEAVERCLAREADALGDCGARACGIGSQGKSTCRRGAVHRWRPLRPRKRGSAPRVATPCRTMPLHIVKQLHEAEVHVELLVAVEQS
jgi:hypothetical protein